VGCVKAKQAAYGGLSMLRGVCRSRYGVPSSTPLCQQSPQTFIFLHFSLKTLGTEGNIYSPFRFPSLHCSIRCWSVLGMESWVGWVAGTFWLGHLSRSCATSGLGLWRLFHISSILTISKDPINTVLVSYSRYECCLQNGFVLCRFLFSLQCLL